ncbi:MAG TPA: ribonuclease H-like YkuK family protein [Thermaerobacter sp.]
MQTPFISPTRGALSFDAMCAEILDYIRAEPDAQYKLIIGTDSQVRQQTQFVTAVVVHRLGKGARYFYQARKQRKITSLRQKIFYEASLSLSLATRLAERLAARGGTLPNVEIHLDVGMQGDTRDLIREIVGMVVGSGFDAKIKPESYAASSVADRHTK